MLAARLLSLPPRLILAVSVSACILALGLALHAVDEVRDCASGRK